MGFALASLVVLAAQWALVSRASVGCATPDLPLAFAVYLGLHTRKELPVVKLWALGLAIDLLGPYPTGLHSLAFVGVGWAAWRFGDRVDGGFVSVRIALLASSAVILRVVQLAALALEGALPSPSKAMHFVGTSALLTVVVGYLAFLLFDRVRKVNEPVLQMEG
ncbi:MAG: hypothetical protein ACYTFG_01125 [Planctomycetota bacterium]|jgi:rod shape-determining protein MreD